MRKRMKSAGGASNGTRENGREAMPLKSCGYPENIGKTQPKDRSLGMKRVKTRMAQKGL